MTLTPESTPAQVTAANAEHFGYNAEVMQSVDTALTQAGGLAFTPDERQRAALRAWVTATDHRIGNVVYTCPADPMGYVHVAEEVTALEDRFLLGRYLERRRETAEHRYQARPVSLIADVERKALTAGFVAAGERFTQRPEKRPGDVQRGEWAAHAGREMADGLGYVVWDRINHRYVATEWAPTAEEIMREVDQLNAKHREHFAARLWD